MRAKNLGLSMMASWCDESLGAISARIASRASLVSLDVRLKKTIETRSKILPLFSRATIVFSNVAPPGVSRIA